MLLETSILFSVAPKSFFLEEEIYCISFIIIVEIQDGILI